MNERFGTSFREERERLGLPQSIVLHFLPVYDGVAYEGNFISRIERGKVKKLDRRLVNVGYNPLPLLIETLPVEAWKKAWEQAQVARFIAALLEPIPPQLIDLARSAADAEAKGLDWSDYGAQARALIR